MGLIRLVVVGFIVLTVIYFCISIYSRSVRREKLEEAWAEDHPSGGDDAARSAYIEKGMAEYHSGLRKKLILLVYVIPVIVVVTILWFTNAN
ncbi:hypothetical protein FHY55_17500 [Oceanicola sp. D3]|uniref:hypothetical protein n=1 Tax=Oceanicola sp. D3 TaxID=2587163 RepID=UPI00111CC697|nr:hypothetical protein [Oceanicola sp. D3]QDC10920.1 hypothetical protein FHY55_17500 [Oceanicola sp. D3]